MWIPRPHREARLQRGLIEMPEGHKLILCQELLDTLPMISFRPAASWGAGCSCYLD